MTVGPIAQPDTQEGEKQGEKRRGHFDNTRCRTIAKHDTPGEGAEQGEAEGADSSAPEQ